MKLRQMEVFHAMMSAGSVTGAAKLLGISQPAVTNLLRYTEDQLHFKLFHRVKGRLHPTSEARTLHTEIDRIFESVRSVRRLAEDLRETKRGILNIVTTPSLGIVALPTALSSFLEDRGQVRIRLQVRHRAEAIEMVASGSVDIGFAFLSVTHPSIEVEELARRQLICIMPRDHPLTALETVSAKDVAAYPMISYSHSQGLNPMIDAAFMEARVANVGAIEVSLVSTAWAIVSTGTGVAIVDSFSQLDTLHPNVAMRPFVPAREAVLELLYPAKKPLSVLAQSFVVHFKEQMAAATPRVD